MKAEILKVIAAEMNEAERKADAAVDKGEMDVHRFLAGAFHALQNLYTRVVRIPL
jgi:hypothetical protein